MKKLPESVIHAWNEREPVTVLTTVSPEGIPNSIYAAVVGLLDESRIVIANNRFAKTQQNILSGTTGSFLFLTKDKKSFQIKGPVTLHESGPEFDEMKRINPPEYPGFSAAVLHVEEVFSGAEQLL